MLCVITLVSYPFFFCGEMIRRQLTGNFAQLCGCIEVGKVRVVVTPPQPHLEVS